MCPIVDYVRHRDRLYNIPMNSSTQIIPLGLPSAPSLPPTAGTRTGGGVPTTLKKGTIVWSKRAYHGKVLQVNDGTYDIVEYGTGDRFTINPEVDDIKNESGTDENTSIRELLRQGRVALRLLNLSNTKMSPSLISEDLCDFVRSHKLTTKEQYGGGGIDLNRRRNEDNSIILEPMGRGDVNSVMSNWGGFYREQPMIRELYLSSMNLGTKGITTLCSGLLSNTSVTTLDISGNQIKDEGLFYVAKVLRRHPTLTSLNVSSNMLTGVSATLLATNMSTYQIGKIVGITPQSLTVTLLQNNRIVHDVATGAILLEKGDLVYEQPKKDEWGRERTLTLRKVLRTQKPGEKFIEVEGNWKPDGTHGRETESYRRPSGTNRIVSENHVVQILRKNVHLPWRTIQEWKRNKTQKQLVRTTPVLGLLKPQMPTTTLSSGEDGISWNEDFQIQVVEKKIYTEEDFMHATEIMDEFQMPTGMYTRPDPDYKPESDFQIEKKLLLQGRRTIHFKEYDWGRRDGTCVVFEIQRDPKTGADLIVTVPREEASRLLDPHETNTTILPASRYSKLVAVQHATEVITIDAVSKTYDIEYVVDLSKGKKQQRTNAAAAPFLVKTQDIPERNVDASRVRSLEGMRHEIGALVEVVKKRKMNLYDEEDIVGVFGTKPCPLQELILNNNDLANVTISRGSPESADKMHMSGFASLLHAVSGSEHMRSLSLCENMLGDHGAMVLSKILSHPHNRTNLTTLLLNQCSISDKGHLAILQMLTCNQALQSVSLLNNMISESWDDNDFLAMLGGSNNDNNNKDNNNNNTAENKNSQECISAVDCEMMMGWRHSKEGGAYDMKWVCPKQGVSFTDEQRWRRWKVQFATNGCASDRASDCDVVKVEEESLKRELVNSLLQNVPTEYHNVLTPYIESDLLTNSDQMMAAIEFFEHDPTCVNNSHAFDMYFGLSFEKAIGVTVVQTKQNTIENVTEELKSRIQKIGDPLSVADYYGGRMTSAMLKTMVANDQENGDQANDVLMNIKNGVIRYSLMSEGNAATAAAAAAGSVVAKKDKDKDKDKVDDARICLWSNVHAYRAEREHQRILKYRTKTDIYVPTTTADIINNKYDITVLKLDEKTLVKITGKTQLLKCGPTSYQDSVQRVVLRPSSSNLK